MDHIPVFIPLGGFLGAGKTTLILTASRLLQARGLKVAAILNDQGSDLVDTQHVLSHGIDAGQVTGGCFCCRFSDLIETAARLRAHSPHVIFAEAVGSCTDISATTLQPLKLHYAGQFQLAPYSVLVDPQRAFDPDPSIAFLFQKQIEEADLLCFTKTDLHQHFPQLTGAPVRYLSPLTGDGVSAWLDEVLACSIPSGARILDIDYQHYARAEASLAWLNCRVSVSVAPALTSPQLVGPLLDRLDAALTAANLHIAHLKLADNSPAGYLKASIIRNGEEPRIEGMLDASPAAEHSLILNIRATGEPELLRDTVICELSKLPGKMEILTMQCFSPAAPNPEFRYA